MLHINSKNFVVGFVGGILGSLLLLSINEFLLPDKIIGTRLSGQYLPSPTPLSSYVPDLWQRILADTSSSVVVVQVFKDNKLFSQGNGIILSADGLVAIPASLTISKGIYQIAYDDKIVKGKLVRFDLIRNLALIKIESSGLDVSDLSSSTYQSGQDILVVGKMANLTSVITASQRGIISYVDGSKVALDVNPVGYLRGAKVVKSSGDMVGMLYVKNEKAFLTGAGAIKEFFDEYIKSIKLN